MGMFYDVYNELGHGFLEIIYERALAIALAQSGLKVEGQVAVWFRRIQIGDFRPDMMSMGRCRLSSKACRTIDQAHERQLLNYLRATDIEVGLRFNFGLKPQFRRLVYENDRKSIIRVDPRESAAS